MDRALSRKVIDFHLTTGLPRVICRYEDRFIACGKSATDTFGVGVDTGAPVSFAYEPPFAFNGSIHRVDIEPGAPG